MCAGRKAFGQITLFIHGPSLIIMIIIINPVGATQPIHARVCKRAICRLIAPAQCAVQTGCPSAGSACFLYAAAARQEAVEMLSGQTMGLLKCATISEGSYPPTPGGEGLFCPCPAAVSCQENTGAMCGTQQFCLIASPGLGGQREYQQHMGLGGSQSFNKHYMLHNKTTIFWYLGSTKQLNEIP